MGKAEEVHEKKARARQEAKMAQFPSGSEDPMGLRDFVIACLAAATPQDVEAGSVGEKIMLNLVQKAYEGDTPTAKVVLAFAGYRLAATGGKRAAVPGKPLEDDVPANKTSLDSLFAHGAGVVGFADGPAL